MDYEIKDLDGYLESVKPVSGMNINLKLLRYPI